MPSKMAGNKDSSSSSSSSPPPPDASGATRLQRNLAEKQRRDKLNGYISELATIVPMVSMASKRLDKTSILRLSAAHLRISQSFLSGSRKRSRGSFKWRPSCFSADQVQEILESVEGFLLVATTNGKIMYVSQTVEKFLCYQNIEMIGHSIFTFIHPSDSDMVKEQLDLLSQDIGKKNGSTSSRCSFYCRLRERGQPRSDVLTYQFVHVVGHLSGHSTGHKEEEECDEHMDDDEESSSESTSSSGPILKAFIRVVHSNPYNELSLTDAIENEYVTRHSPNGMIVFADHRLSTITGHLPHEVYGKSAYAYILQEDTIIAAFAHRLMFSTNGGTGMIVYRLRTRNGGFVYLKSTGYLQFEKSSTQVDHFVCVNKQLSDDEGEEELKKFRDRFTPHISDHISLFQSIKAIQENSNLLITDDVKTDLPAVAISPMEVDVASPAEKSNGSSKSKDKKVLVETDGYLVVNRQLAIGSPLTEGSPCTNSPQSEDTCSKSPVNMASDRIDIACLTPRDTSSSSCDLISCVADDIQSYQLVTMPAVLTVQSVLEVDSLLNLQAANAQSLITSEEVQLPIQNVWQGSSGTNVCTSELSLQTPTSSSEISQNPNNYGC